MPVRWCTSNCSTSTQPGKHTRLHGSITWKDCQWSTLISQSNPFLFCAAQRRGDLPVHVVRGAEPRLHAHFTSHFCGSYPPANNLVCLSLTCRTSRWAIQSESPLTLRSWTKNTIDNRETRKGMKPNNCQEKNTLNPQPTDSHTSANLSTAPGHLRKLGGLAEAVLVVLKQ